MFVAVLGTVSRFYHVWPLAALLASALATLVGLLTVRLLARRPWLGRMLIAAALTGTAGGLHIYYRSMLYYFHYRAAVSYTNIAASQPALMLADAGSVRFTSDSRVDGTRSVGFQSALDATRFCIAPVVDSSMSPTEPVSFFAVGVGCCSWRGRFHCDDAEDASAKGALMSVSPQELVSPFMQWAVRDPVQHESYEDALLLQQAVYATPLAKQVRLLRWTKDPANLQDAFLSQALVTAAVYIILFTALNALVAVSTVFGPAHVLKDIRSLVR